MLQDNVNIRNLETQNENKMKKKLTFELSSHPKRDKIGKQHWCQNRRIPPELNMIQQLPCQ